MITPPIKRKTVNILDWIELPETVRWLFNSCPTQRVGRYVKIDGQWYDISRLSAKNSARVLGCDQWEYAFKANSTGDGILIRPTKSDAGKWPHEWSKAVVGIVSH